MFKASRSRVATSRMVGNTVKSSGRSAYTDTSSTTSPKAMLNVNSMSSAIGGSGITTIASIMMTISGAPRPWGLSPLSCAVNVSPAIYRAPVSGLFVGWHIGIGALGHLGSMLTREA